MKNILKPLAVTLGIVFGILAMCFIVNQIPYENPLHLPQKEQKQVVLEYVDKSTSHGIRVYIKDLGIFDVNIYPLPEIESGDTVKIVYYQRQIVDLVK